MFALRKSAEKGSANENGKDDDAHFDDKDDDDEVLTFLWS